MYIVAKGGNNIIWRWIIYYEEIFPGKETNKKEVYGIP